MGRFIVKLDDYYFEWSSIVDAPVTYGMTKQELEKYYQEEYGRSGMAKFSLKIDAADRNGHSALLPFTLEELIELNHAGDNGENLTKDQIIAKYTRQLWADSQVSG